MDSIEMNRSFLKSCIGKIDMISDREKGLPFPSLFKEKVSNNVVELAKDFKDIITMPNIQECIENRISRRKFINEPVSLVELSYLLWATQGLKKIISHNIGSYRNVPSGGGKHTFETYIYSFNVTSLENGLYHYLPCTHDIEYLKNDQKIANKFNKATFEQSFIINSAAVFIWSCIPYRSEWKYNLAAHKTILLDAGHMCQNLYLACESVGLGTCAIAAYNQDILDEIINVDGKNEFSIYLAPVGRVK